MGLFNVNKAAKNQAKTYENLVQDQQTRLQEMNFGRDLLQNIRQERVARAQLEFSNHIEGVSTSSAAGAIANIDSGLASEVGYAYRYSLGLEKLQSYQETAANYWEKYAKSVQKVQRNAKIVGSVMSLGGQIVGTAIGGPVGGAIGATLGSLGAVGITTAMGGGSTAGKAAFGAGMENTMSYIGDSSKDIAKVMSDKNTDIWGNKKEQKQDYSSGDTEKRIVQVTGYSTEDNAYIGRYYNVYNSGSYTPYGSLQTIAEARRLVP